MLGAIESCEAIAERELNWQLSDRSRVGDHRWWIADLKPFRRDYPGWDVTHDLDSVLRDIHERNAEMWLAA